MFKYRLAYVVWRVGKNLTIPFLQFLGRLYAFFWSVQLEGNVRFLGVPRFRNLGSIKIGRSTRIISDNRNIVGSYTKTFFETGVNGVIEIGSHCGLSNCHIISQEGVTIGDYVFIGGGTRIYDNDFHSIDPEIRINQPNVIPSGKVKIGDRSFIGGHCLILKGVEVGANSVLGAGSVLTKSIPPNEVWGGAPAKKIGTLIND